MEFQIVQLSSLEKVRAQDSLRRDEIHKKTVLAGERLSYQICMRADCRTDVAVSAESDLPGAVRLYLVQDVYMDVPAKEEDMEGEDYITLEPGFMPDILVPLEEQGGRMAVSSGTATVWVKVDVPRDTPAGNYRVKVKILPADAQSAEVPAAEEAAFTACETMEIRVISASVPQQRLIYTRWFYADCIAVQHGVEIYSEKHWELIDKYIAAAADVGINMILVPIHTPPLDTAVGTVRPCVQLVDIEKKGDSYEFSFEKFRRFIDICRKNGVRYFEMAHMFSQWGAKCAPNIMVTENGKKDYMFGWHVAADSPEYVSFLKQYIAAISEELAAEGISEQTYFHISDEPSLESMETYKTASDIMRPLIGESKTFDALSNYDFYENGLIECPVTSVEHIHAFLEHEIENQWAYYCCGPEKVFTNSFLAMPSHRVRVLGFLLYRYNIKGFLHWGLNFYNCCVSKYPVNPYVTTSGDKAFPSGDPFILYPGRDSVYPSIRGEVTYEAVQDMDICFALERYVGREAVTDMIDRAAGRKIRFDDYPKNKEFLENLRAEMVEKIRELSDKTV
ncbi:MAG: DUF4091 domain-containing protein [Lachnospiraceae bacterium]|nr:DUF4091 domain-containing protein [Lachnospiraceae bacterium]